MTKQIQESKGNPEAILDSITLKIVRVLLENPKIPYTKTSLAKSANISKDALYSRWDTLTETRLVQKADVESGHDHYQFNPDSEIADLLGKLLYDVLKGDTE